MCPGLAEIGITATPVIDRTRNANLPRGDVEEHAELISSACTRSI